MIIVHALQKDTNLRFALHYQTQFPTTIPLVSTSSARVERFSCLFILPGQNRTPIEPELSLSVKSAPELWSHWAISGPSLFGLFRPPGAVEWGGDERLLCALGQWGQPEGRGKVIISQGHHQPRLGQRCPGSVGSWELP